MTSQPLYRRTLLRGGGATIALPYLEMMDARGASSASAPGAPQRLCWMFQRNGNSLDQEVAAQIGGGTPHSNLLHTIGHAMGLEQETF